MNREEFHFFDPLFLRVIERTRAYFFRLSGVAGASTPAGNTNTQFYASINDTHYSNAYEEDDF
jgi:hypothetical protein